MRRRRGRHMKERNKNEKRQKRRNEKERKERLQARDKSKTPRGTSKQNSPIDLADSVVGKSPGRLGETLTSVWGSQSKAVTPAASPWPAPRSVGPTTPKTGNPLPTESRKATPRNVQAKLSTPATPALGEARQSLAVEQTVDDATKNLSVEVPQHQYVGSTEGVAHTPADSLPPDQFTTVGVSQEPAGDIHTTQSNMENETQGSAVSGAFDSWDNNVTGGDWTSGGQSGGDGWTDLISPSGGKADKADKAGPAAGASSLPSLSWGVGGSNKWPFSSPKAFGSGLTGALGGFSSFLGTGDHGKSEPKPAETRMDSLDDIPLDGITSQLEAVLRVPEKVRQELMKREKKIGDSRPARRRKRKVVRIPASRRLPSSQRGAVVAVVARRPAAVRRKRRGKPTALFHRVRAGGCLVDVYARVFVCTPRFCFTYDVVS
ncbi:hypothetical protein BKA82DRAFT_2477730 [Pisolithus tinctorius]|nr:hypothetical protein BKA82DRAFT_2477730 [Pisolithus tinctorius]